MKAYVITIAGLPLSEESAERCVASGREFGYAIARFPATDRYRAGAEMRAHGLSIDSRIYTSISNRPVGNRDTIPSGSWWLTTPEVGCFMSHYRLWLRCLELGEPILILEHDAVLIAKLPGLPRGAVAMDLFNRPYRNSAAYLLAPGGARLAVTTARKRGIQPADELLWRTALKRRRIAVARPPAVRVEDGGRSSIQFSKRDEHHRDIVHTDPWTEFRVSAEPVPGAED